MTGFAEAWPFPHASIDGMFDESLLDDVIDQWPTPDDRDGWAHFSNDREEKWAWTNKADLWPAAFELVYGCNQQPFLDWLETLTGIPRLLADPELVGGGPHEIMRGGKLGVHVDFNRHPTTGLDRRLNALLYLNRGWRDEWGGQIELWDQDRRRSVSYTPVFNRLVVFATTSTSWHGHPTPLACPEGVTRRSVAFYYYTDGRPDGETTGTHSTIFADVHGA